MSAKNDDDKKLVERALDGEFGAFEQLVDKYEGRIFRHLRKMVKDPQIAEDLLQDTFLNAYKGLKGFTGASSFATWLFRIATNNALMYLRKRRPETVEYDDEIKSDLETMVTASSPEFVQTPDERLLSEEGRAQIEAALDELPVHYRSVIVLRDVEGFSLEEVAHVLDCSVAAVKSRLHRARTFVREVLSTYYSDKTFASARGVS